MAEIISEHTSQKIASRECPIMLGFRIQGGGVYSTDNFHKHMKHLYGFGWLTMPVYTQQ